VFFIADAKSEKIFKQVISMHDSGTSLLPVVLLTAILALIILQEALKTQILRICRTCSFHGIKKLLCSFTTQAKRSFLTIQQRSTPLVFF